MLVLEPLFIKVAGLGTETLFKKGIFLKCFPENVLRYLMTLFFTEPLQVLLNIGNNGNGWENLYKIGQQTDKKYPYLQVIAHSVNCYFLKRYKGNSDKTATGI